jgi:hypothetical protein
MPSLTSLPNEILLNVAQQLRADVETLANLSLACRKLQSIAQEVLYECINIDCGNEDYADHIYHYETRWGGGGVHAPPKFARLIRTIGALPGLSDTTKEIHIDIYARFRSSTNYWHTIDGQVDEELAVIDGKWSREVRLRFREHCRDRVRELFSPMDIPTVPAFDYIAWASRMGRGQQSALAGLVLLLTRHLTKLNLTIRHNTRENNNMSMGPLKNLFGIDHWEHSDETLEPFRSRLNNVEEITTFDAHLPILLLLIGLKYLHVKMSGNPAQYHGWLVGNRRQNRSTYAATYEHAHLETLVVETFTNELHHRDELPQVNKTVGLPECAALRNLTVLMRGFHRHADPNSRLVSGPSFSTLIDNISAVAETLEFLDIDYLPLFYFGWWQKRWNNGKGPFVPCASLLQFSRLRRLAVPEPALGRFNPDRRLTELLPPSLEELTVYHPTGRLLAWLDCLLTALPDLPVLRTVTLKCRPSWGKSAAWFRLQENPVFQRLRERGIAVWILQDQVVSIEDKVVTRVVDETNVWQNIDEESWLASFENMWNMDDDTVEETDPEV